ncbi:MAG: VWA domain-containing protein [Thermoanaerobaculia bacterium]|nr:VWA domain-containing protein [Thermoanaerobaculia bacterium]
MRRRSGIAGLALLLAAAVCPPLGAQSADRFSEEVSVGYVLVPVAVRSREGFVRGLELDDFTLRVDGREVAIDSFERAGEAPVRLALLQDLSGSMDLGGKLEGSRRALDCLLEGARPADRFALASFAGRRLRVEVPFTGDLSALREAAMAWQPYGVTALHDAVASIPRIAISRQAPNAAAVLVTDGVENASSLAPEEARRVVRSAKIPVYVLGFGRSAGDEGEAGEPDTYARVLRRLASFTGGRYFPMEGPEGVEPACAEIAAETRSRYVLGFATRSEGASVFREIRVEVGKRSSRVSHRRGYTGPAPAG